MKVFSLLLLTLVGAQPEQQPQLLIPGPSPTSVQFAITFGDQLAEQVWSEFLGHWRVMFDANGDGQLNAVEAANVPALTNPSGSPIRFDIKAADTNNDALASGDEILTYYTARGLTTVHTTVQNDAATIQASATLWKLLDTDRDDKLSPSELAAAAQLLNRWDLNEDECLAFDELPSAIAGNLPPPIVSWLPDRKTPSEPANILTIPIKLDSLKNPQPFDSSRDSAAPLKRLDRQRLRLDLPDAKVTVLFGESSAQRIVVAQQYLLGEINLARGNRPSLDPAAIKADPELDWLAAFAAVADRDGEQQFSEAELKSVTELLAEGAAAQFGVAALFRGRNLFDHWDTNSDNQLDRRELLAATRLKSPSTADAAHHDAALVPSDIPLSITVKLQRGPPSGRFGRLRIARRQSEPVTKGPASTELPRWFKAMDRNRDNSISPDEFLGTSAQFEGLDWNGDGLISDAELR